MATEVALDHAVSLYDRWHSGERKMQDLVHVRDAVQESSRIFRPFLTTQMQDFIPGLNYFFIGTLDSQGRPWVSILTGALGFLQSPDIKTLEIKTQLPAGPSQAGAGDHVADPIFSNLLNGETFKQGRRMWGGVGLDFTNRRRNKMNGVLYPHDILTAEASSGSLHVRLTVEQTIGNCPKYITIREFEPDSADGAKHSSEPVDAKASCNVIPGRASSVITEQQAAIIRQADCLFISSRFIDESLADQTSGMDCNHRGGNPGFVHLERNCIVFPDYSGNRFFNTLGNIINDDRVGILFLSFDTGDTLHLTGHARIFVGKEAQALYPHAQRCVQVDIEDALLRKSSLPFRMRTKELSPYNPTISSRQRSIIADSGEGRVTATLSAITRHTNEVSSFLFSTSKPVHYDPGQYALLDFSDFTSEYRHMAQDNPKSLNDDHIRSWTISSAPSRSKGGTVGCGAWDETSEFTLTIKRKPGGSISNLLHDLVVNDKQPLVVPLISTAGTFVLPVPKTLPSAAPYAQQKVALISGGIGSTPFISMIRGARQSTAPALDLRWVMSARYFEDLLPQILQELTSPAHTQDTGDSLNEESSLSLTVDAFLTRASAISVTAPVQHYGLHDVRVHFERLGINGLQSAIPDIQDRTILLCGPEPFMEAVKGYLQELSIPAGQILTEDFNF